MKCPICSKPIDSTPMEIPPFRIPSPFTDCRDKLFTVLVKPTQGTFLMYVFFLFNLLPSTNGVVKVRVSVVSVRLSVILSTEPGVSPYSTLTSSSLQASPTLSSAQGPGSGRPSPVQAHSTWTSLYSPSPTSQTHSNLFTMKYRLSESGWLVFD